MSCLQSPCGCLIFGANCRFSSFRAAATVVAVTVVIAMAAAPPACDRSIVLRPEEGEEPPWAGGWDVTEFTPQSSSAFPTRTTTTLTVSEEKHFHPPSLLLAFSLRQIEGLSTCFAHLQNVATGLYVHIFINAATAQLALIFPGTRKTDGWNTLQIGVNHPELILPQWVNQRLRSLLSYSLLS